MIHAIAHLIDDASFGGINRMLEYMEASPDLAKIADHRIVRVRRGQLTAPPLGADLIVSHLSVNWANLPMLTALRAAYPTTPIIHVEHSYSERFVALHVEKRDRFTALLRTAYALFDEVVAVSETQGAWMLRRGFCPEGGLKVIEPCVELAPFLAVEGHREGPDIVIGAIGRFDLQKGFDILIDAFQVLERTDVELHLYGDGPDLNDLKARAKNNPKIVFKGYTSDVPEAMAACDAIALPSRWEPYGLVAIEAMAADRPVLCPRHDGLVGHIAAGARDIGENSVTGWAAAIERLDVEELREPNAKTRTHAAEAGERFAKAWSSLVGRVLSKEDEEAGAA
ncbi:glycosyltransferase family 4 protein [Afifella sp. H1R]|uniref:glycosyltransferase family 4 protein n=1 Tax=Afifella sp. H1R TaxID=2908841 RepID=UPI001F3B81FD|nr:glycosyltransferase family 4 protein [Afifella sp. H1R]MCF1502427.1 glycosyltransferase family 4 protein [Afifella sp. H1R]